MFRIISITGRGVFNRELSTVKAIGSEYEYVTNREAKSREIDVLIDVRARTSKELRKKIDDISAFFNWEGYKPVIFSDEPDMTYYAEYEGYEEVVEHYHVHIHRGIIKLLVQPHKFSDEETIDIEDDVTLVENKGNEPTPPIIELKALKPVTYAMVENGIGEYNLIGFPLEEDGQEQVVDEKVSIMREGGSTLSQWSDNYHEVDTNFNDVTGHMGYDGTGIRAESYGAGDKIHGPAITRELPKSLRDFEIQAHFDIISNREEHNFRMEVYFMDENLNMLGKMGVKDNSRVFKRRYALGRVGQYRGSGKTNGYAIGKHNYARDINATNTLFYLWVRREGNLYTFWVGRWRNHKYEWIKRATYRDVNGDYNGRLKYITLFIGSYKDRSRPSRMRINSVEVFELKTLTENQTPYIIYKDDIVTFDHNNEEVLINGEMTDLIHFGNTYWQLMKGYNNLVISPPGAFDATIKFEEKYK